MSPFYCMCFLHRTARYLQWLHHVLSKAHFEITKISHDGSQCLKYLFIPTYYTQSGFYKHIFFPVYLLLHHIQHTALLPFSFSPSLPLPIPTSLLPFPSHFSMPCAYMSVYIYIYIYIRMHTYSHSLCIHIMRKNAEFVNLNLAYLP